MTRRFGQVILRGDCRWLIRHYLGRDHETKKRNYPNPEPSTVRGVTRKPRFHAPRLTEKS